VNSILVQMFEVDFNITSHFCLVPRLEAFGTVPSILLRLCDLHLSTDTSYLYLLQKHWKWVITT